MVLQCIAKEVYVTITIDTKLDFYRIYGEHELFLNKILSESDI